MSRMTSLPGAGLMAIRIRTGTADRHMQVPTATDIRTATIGTTLGAAAVGVGGATWARL